MNFKRFCKILLPVLVFSLGIGLTIGGISELCTTVNRSFTREDLEITKCLGCRCPNLKIRPSDKSEYCCTFDEPPERQAWSLCETVSSCKDKALSTLEYFDAVDKLHKQNGLIIGGIGLALFIPITVYILLKLRKYLIIRRAARQIMRRMLQNFRNNIGALVAESTEPSEPLLESVIIPSEDQCSICFHALKQLKGVKLNCGHQFHKVCLTQWIKHKKTCPNCRVSIK